MTLEEAQQQIAELKQTNRNLERALKGTVDSSSFRYIHYLHTEQFYLEREYQRLQDLVHLYAERFAKYSYALTEYDEKVKHLNHCIKHCQIILALYTGIPHPTPLPDETT
jgi:predicted AlkP superfamily phosphohydrolase/phosphomutase